MRFALALTFCGSVAFAAQDPAPLVPATKAWSTAGPQPFGSGVFRSPLAGKPFGAPLIAPPPAVKRIQPSEMETLKPGESAIVCGMRVFKTDPKHDPKIVQTAPPSADAPMARKVECPSAR